VDDTVLQLKKAVIRLRTVEDEPRLTVAKILEDLQVY
jgi:hypothetical protein